MAKEISTPAIDGPKFGVFDSAKVYDPHAIARILGRTDYRWVIRRLFFKGLPHTRVGNQYLTSGRSILRWVEEHEQIWQQPDSSSSSEAAEKRSSSAGSRPPLRRGAKSRLVELPDAVTPND